MSPSFFEELLFLSSLSLERATFVIATINCTIFLKSEHYLHDYHFPNFLSLTTIGKMEDADKADALDAEIVLLRAQLQDKQQQKTPVLCVSYVYSLLGAVYVLASSISYLPCVNCRNCRLPSPVFCLQSGVFRLPSNTTSNLPYTISCLLFTVCRPLSDV
jgi:hypothetical protein